MTPESAATDLLAMIGKTGESRLTPLPGGRNNTVWRVDCGGETFLLKKYFWSESDPRDRLGQEWAFFEFLRRIGSGKGPTPLAKDAATRHALLEFIPGLPPAEISETDVLDAAAFFAAMNAARDQAAHLPPVSEACFSLEAHLDTVARRIAILSRITPVTEEHAAAIEFVGTDIAPLWHRIRGRIERLPAASRAAVLPVSDRCISPSDFGFHNALRQADGSLRYVDFEYAGWDDPAKTLIDFTNQPDRILPEDLARTFIEATVPLFANQGPLRDRLALLTPLYQLKWACICLNAFLPGRPSNPARPLGTQLARSRTMALRAADPRHGTD